MNTRLASVESTPIALMDTDEIGRILDHVHDIQTAPIGLNRSYLYEIATSEMMEVFYTETDGLDNVFYGYYVDDGVAIEDWLHGGESFIRDVDHLVDLHPDGEVLFAFDSQDMGDRFGWTFKETLGEMYCSLDEVTVSDSCHRFSGDKIEQVVDILSGGWWNHPQAQNFVETTTGNPDGVTKLATSNAGTVVGFAHAAYDNQSAWINIVFIEEESRNQGLGKELVMSLLAALKEVGVADVYLGVDRNNDEATSLYSSLGFEFTPFKKWQFEVTRD